MIDEENCILLSKLVNRKEQPSRIFYDEYVRLVKPKLQLWSDNKPLSQWISQTGGKVYTLSTTKRKIDIEIEELTSETVDDDGVSINQKILFFHPQYAPDFKGQGKHFLKYCVLVKIFSEFQMAEISDLNRYFPCFSVKELKYGHIMLRGVLFYLDKYRERLGVKTVELQDEASHWCGGNPNFNLKLVISRQLLGDFPYYWQFGFRPIVPIVESRIIFNMAKMAEYRLDHMIIADKNIIDYINYKLEMSPELLTTITAEYMDRLKNSKLVDFIKWLSLEHCQVYFYLYDDLFRDLGLVDPYRHVDNRWILEYSKQLV